MEIIQRIDEIGKAAWIGLMVLAFIVWWPLGVALAAFLIWSGRMLSGRHGRHEGFHTRWSCGPGRWYARHSSSGNAAFDEYREETLRRLEDEQQEFKSFLDRLRKAKDKAEFDQFMAEHRRPSADRDEKTQTD